MKYLVLSVFLTGCAFGPVEITHTRGEVPKVYVNSGYDPCKFKTGGGISVDELHYQCKWDIEI